MENDNGPAPVDSTRNWLLTLAYKGTAYAGWQIQPGSATIQGKLEDALSDLFGSPIRVSGCSRTDAGVHALDQRATLRLPLTPSISPENTLRALNGRLPDDIHIIAIDEMPPEFHARYNAVGKAYTYVIHVGDMVSPFLRDCCWQVRHELNPAAMERTAGMLIGTHDFTTFSAAGSTPDQDPVKTLDRIPMERVGSFLMIIVIGDSFLYKMVRRLVGYLVEVGRGRLDCGDAPHLLEARDRNVGFDTAPAAGLFLDRVFYNETEFCDYLPQQLPFLRLSDLPPFQSIA